jgi:adenine-specific DNA-methyltransferase
VAVINELISKVEDAALRERLQQEVSRLVKNKKFGLIFEEHIPECTPLYGIEINKESTVAVKGKSIKDTLLVVSVNGDMVKCFNKTTKEIADYQKSDLVVVSQFGEPIYPQLIPIDKVENAPDSKLWHALIEADNYHALQLLEYMYPKQVDCIYIDPPYNTGAKDWKYNNDYVDSSDSYRHSKWLSMMKKRLLIAKNLLKSDGVLIITIDDNELAHLYCLVEMIFPEFQRFIVTIEHNKRGRRGKNIAKTNEYALFLFARGLDILCEEPMLGIGGEVRNLRRTGSGSLRTERPNKFYPIYVDTLAGEVVHIGDSINVDAPVSYEVPVEIKQMFSDRDICVVWPYDEDGKEKNWHYAAPRAKTELLAGKISAKQQAYGWQVYYQLKEKDSKKYKSVWTGNLFDASTYGTELLSSILGREKAFDYPKSLYAVHQSLYAAIGNRKDAIVVDFFAGSGTTLQAVNLLNKEDNGYRRCILITNNEVSEKEADELRLLGLSPNEADWERQGICQAVTWPRTVNSITGKRLDGNVLDGEYITNLVCEKNTRRNFSHISFVSSSELDTPAKKRQLIGLLGKDKLPQSLVKDDSKYIVSEKNRASILFDDSYVEEWLNALEDQYHIIDFYIVTSARRLFNTIKKRINDLLGDDTVQEPLKIPMSDGFKANAEYFKLGFLDKNSVELGDQFKAILPILWMQAGSIGKRPEIAGSDIPPMLIPENSSFAVLVDETRYAEFRHRIAGNDQIQYVYLVTESQTAYQEMASQLNIPYIKQLYRDYIDNFTINIRRDV